MGANITVRIEVNAECQSGGNLSVAVTSGHLPINISRKYCDTNKLCNTKWNGGLSLDTMHKFGDKLKKIWRLGKDNAYNGYVWRVVDNDYNIPTALGGAEKLVLLLSASTNVKFVTIVGDEANGQYPTELQVLSGGSVVKTITSNDVVTTIDFGNTVSATRTVRISKWKRKNFNAIITHLEGYGETITFDEQWIDNVDTLSQSTANNNQYSTGVIANTGSLSLFDRDNYISNLIKYNIVSKQPNIDIYMKNTLVQRHFGTGVNSRESKVNFDLTNSFADMDNSVYAGCGLSGDRSFYSLFCEVVGSYLNRGRSIQYCDSLFETMKITGVDSVKTTALSAKRSIQTTVNNKYYISCYVLVNNNTSLKVGVMCHDIEIGAFGEENNWVRVSGIIMATKTASTVIQLNYENNFATNRTATFRDLIIVDLTRSGIADKDKAWCDANIKTSADVDNMFSGGMYFNQYWQYDTIKAYLESTKIPLPYINSGSHLDTINKLCQIFALRVYADDNGNIKVVSALSKVFHTMVIDSWIPITRKYLFGGVTADKFAGSVVDNIKIETKVASLVETELNELTKSGYPTTESGIDTSYNPQTATAEPNFAFVDKQTRTSGDNSREFFRYLVDVNLDKKTLNTWFGLKYKITKISTSNNKEYGGSLVTVAQPINFVRTLDLAKSEINLPDYSSITKDVYVVAVAEGSTEQTTRLLVSFIGKQVLWGNTIYTTNISFIPSLKLLWERGL